jgi:hypothetical protein
MLIIGMGAATPVSVVNLSIALLGHLASAAGKLRDRPKVEAPLNASELAAVKAHTGAEGRGRALAAKRGGYGLKGMQAVPAATSGDRGAHYFAHYLMSLSV